MTHVLNETHDTSLQSWVESANAAGADFPIQNLPFGVFTRRGSHDHARVGVAIGDRVLDIGAAHEAGLFAGAAVVGAAACRTETLNALLALGAPAWSSLRLAVSRLLRAEPGRTGADVPAACTVPMADCDLALPIAIGGFTDFYASVYHATNVGRMFRPDQPLMPNYKWVPVGYHGRASSVVVSGTAIRRPLGQARPDGATVPSFGPTRRLDYEVEIGAVIGPGNPMGTPIPIASAAERVFGLVLLNDWSARDVQAWEYQPLGPFLAKNFATTISPWIVTLEALAPFRAPAFARPLGDPAPLPYLADPDDAAHGAFDITLDATLCSAMMRAGRTPPMRVSRGHLTDLYWTIAQMVTHHASGGCDLRPGDLIGTGTVSGPTSDSRGCLLELTSRGESPVLLPSGEKRAFLEDGDEVALRGWCERDGATRIGFGECRGVILPAVAG